LYCFYLTNLTHQMSLFDAARSGDAELIKTLADEGGDVHKTNYYGYTAVRIAKQYKGWKSVFFMLGIRMPPISLATRSFDHQLPSPPHPTTSTITIHSCTLQHSTATQRCATRW
jgi:hypothetical protein